MTISVTSIGHASATLSICYSMEQKTIHYEVTLFIAAKKRYERTKYTDFAQAVEAYRTAEKEVKEIQVA